MSTRSRKRWFFVGLDVHWQQTTVCILNQHGKQIKRLTIRGPWKDVLPVLQRLRGHVAVCYEASCGYGHLYDLLRAVCQRVLVAHPGQLRLIFRSKRKNDRFDAAKLAKLLFLNEVPAVHVPRLKVRAWRQLIEYRSRLVEKRVRCKNSLRALLRSLGILAPRGFGLWTRRGLEWLRTLELPELYALRRDLLHEELLLLARQISRAEKELEHFSRRHPAVALLRTIPGVGIRTAEAMVAYIDDPQRFGSNKAIGAYFGLVPCQDQSAAMNRYGHITKEGPATARKLLTEAAWQGIRRSPTIRAYFDRVCRADPDRRKIALVATSHYLARVMQAMLRSGEAWRETSAQAQRT
jgi:transposase